MLPVRWARIWESRGRVGVQGGPGDGWEDAEGQGGVFLRSPAGHRVLQATGQILNFAESMKRPELGLLSSQLGDPGYRIKDA